MPRLSGGAPNEGSDEHEVERRCEAPEGRTMTRRTRRSMAGSVLVVLGLVIGAVIVTALQAEGRERSRADTNDGGAWLLKRDAGYVGHVNREVGEVTAAVSVSDPGLGLRRRPGRRDHRRPRPHDRCSSPSSTTPSSASPTRPACASVRTSAVHAVDGGALIVDSVVDGRVEADPRAAAVGRVHRRGRGARHRRGRRGVGRHARRPRRDRRRGRRQRRVRRPRRHHRRQPGRRADRRRRVDHLAR